MYAKLFPSRGHVGQNWTNTTGNTRPILAVLTPVGWPSRGKLGVHATAASVVSNAISFFRFRSLRINRQIPVDAAQSTKRRGQNRNYVQIHSNALKCGLVISPPQTTPTNSPQCILRNVRNTAVVEYSRGCTGGGGQRRPRLWNLLQFVRVFSNKNPSQ